MPTETATEEKTSNTCSVCSYCGNENGQGTPVCRSCGMNLNRCPREASAKVMRLSGLALLLLLATSFIVYAERVWRNPSEFDHIPIEGSRPFRIDVVEALKLLKQRSPESYSTVTNYIGAFVQSPHTGMAAWADPPISFLHDRWSWQSIESYAAGITHESFHSKLYHDFLDPKGFRLLQGKQDFERISEIAGRMEREMNLAAGEVWGGESAEKQCCEYQVKVLKEIGGTAEEIQSCTFNPSNRYWEIPWEKRNW